jgi:hypothetical protein
MKKRNQGFFVLALIMLIVSTESCGMLRNTQESNCPTNDPNYFFKKAGAKPTKYYIRTNKFSQRRYKY